KALIFSYDVYGRLNQITTATGETVSFVYGDLDGDSDPSNNRVVTQVNTPGGYVATFGYEHHADSYPEATGWYLTNITDTVGISSVLTYGVEDSYIVAPWSVQALTTPYWT